MKYPSSLDDQDIEISLDDRTRLPQLVQRPVPVVVIILAEILQTHKPEEPNDYITQDKQYEIKKTQ